MLELSEILRSFWDSISAACRVNLADDRCIATRLLSLTLGKNVADLKHYRMRSEVKRVPERVPQVEAIKVCCAESVGEI